MDPLTIIIIIAGLIILGYIISKKLDNFKIEPDTKAFSDLTTKSFSDIASRITKVETEMKTKMEETQKNQERIDNQRDNLAKQNMGIFQEQITTLNRMFTGTKERGEIGENMLKEILNPFIKSNKVIKNLHIDNKVVEFAWKVSQNKYIPIDSKLPDVLDLYKKYSETKSKKEQLDLKKKILDKVRKRVIDAKKYRNKKNTTDKVVIAIPDAIFEIIPEVNSDIQKTNILVAGYHLVVYAASYIEREYLLILESGDVGEYKESINSILRLIEEIKDKTKTIDKGVVMIKNANDDIKDSSMEAEHQKPKEKKKIIVKVKEKIKSDEEE